MKKLFLAVTILGVVLTTSAQKKANFTAEQKAALKTKQLTLALDLTNSQQDEIYELQVNAIKKHQEKKEGKADRNSLSDTQKYEMRMQHLDEKIAIKQKYKSILNEKQYEKWEKMQMRKAKKRKIRKREFHKK